MKRKKLRMPIWSFSIDHSQDTPGGDKFDLFLKVKEIKQLSVILGDISKKEKKDRLSWLDENEGFIDYMLGDFMDSSLDILDGMKMDEEAMMLSADLMTELRSSTNIMRNLIREHERN